MTRRPTLPKAPLLLIAGLLAALCIAAITLVLCARNGLLTPSESEMRARYALADSQFTDVDGQAVHFVDQGQGPVIMLLHGSFGSLRNWNVWVARLVSRYRVIRFDRPRMGLSGAEPAGRSGSEQEMRVIAALAAKLRVDRFFLVATSSAGAAAAAYASEHPTQIRGLVLANVAVGPFEMDRAHLPAIFKLLLRIDPVFHGWHPLEFWRQVLLTNFYDPDKVTSAQAREWQDLNNRAQRMPRVDGARSSALEFERSTGDFARMSVPTLLLWSDHDHELPLETVGRRGLKVLGSHDKSLEVIPNCGHMMPLECGEQSVTRAAAFFDRLSVVES